MEQIIAWLTVTVIKALNFPFIAGYAKLKNQKESESLDLGELGDNVPYVFITNSNTG
jgi:hypothetical protein